MVTDYGHREKCYSCFRPKSSCMCEHINVVDTSTKFVILMHPKEFKKVKNNTGFFTHLSLKNSEVFIGIDFTNNKQINKIIDTHESYILFPSSNALNLSEENSNLICETKKPMAIFLIDSTWACTKKMFTLSQNLNKLKHMSFTTTTTSQYKIKEQPKSNYLSTIESTLVVLKELNRLDVEKIEAESFATFLNPFFKMIEYQQNLIENPSCCAVRYKKRVG